MPNAIAYFAILIWPVLSIVFYKRLSALTATFLTIIGGYLLLPVRTAIDPPLIPPINKDSVIALSAMIGCIFIKKLNLSLLPRTGIEKWLVLIYVCLPFFTYITNTEPLFDGRYWLPSLTIHDAIASSFANYMKMIIFILALQLIKTSEDQIKIFKFLTIAGLCYSLPILLEIRLSPQLHTWIYGFFPHVFGQQIRGDGYRAVVFLGHGLLVAMFILVTLASATVLWRNRINIYGIPTLLIMCFLAIVLVLSKTFSAYFLAILLIPSIIFLSSGLMNTVSKMLILMVILYPLLTFLKIMPHQEILDFVSSLNSERASSLAYRFHMETILIEHASEKTLFGWGGWNRNRPWGAVPDGYWIVLFGSQGLMGFLAVFGLSVVATMKGVRACNLLADKSMKNILAAHILLIVVIMIDQLPNSSMSGIYIWFLLGALIGRANHIIGGNTHR